MGSGDGLGWYVDASWNDRLAMIPCQQRSARKSPVSISTRIRGRENTFVNDFLHITEVGVGTRLYLGAQNDEICQILIKSHRDTVLRVIDKTCASTDGRTWRVSLGLGVLIL